MSNVSNLAFPYDTHTGLPRHPGLTKREYAAIAALQGLLAADSHGTLSYQGAAEQAVGHTDALLAELERTK